MMATIFNSSILNSAILDSAILHKTLTQTSSIWLKLIYSDSTWWYQQSWTLPSWIQTLPSWIEIPCYLLSDSLKNTLPLLWPWLKLNQSDYLNDVNLLEFFHPGFCHLGFSHFEQNSDSNTFNLTQTHSFWLNLMMAAILNSSILDSAILHKKNFTHSFWFNLMMAAILNSAMLDSDTAILDSNTLLSSLRFTRKHSPSTLTLFQTNSIWLT